MLGVVLLGAECGRSFFKCQRIGRPAKSISRGLVPAETISKHSESKLAVHGEGSKSQDACGTPSYTWSPRLERVLT
jgi:hypothetical protein